jgi:DNA invertase Pin-like site-specific DNA recombinase
VTLIGYARVSTEGQKDDSQVDELLAAGCDPDNLFIDHGVSGKLASRPQLDACLKYLRKGDTLVITRLSRAMRSIRDLLNIAHDLKERGIDLKVLKQNIDTTTAAGRFQFNVLAAVDEFQRELIVESTLEGLAAARARGRKGGSKPKLSPAQRKRARELYELKGPDGKRAHTVAEVGAMLGVSRQTIYRALGQKES